MPTPETARTDGNALHVDQTVIDLDDHVRLGASTGEVEDPPPDTWEDLAGWIDLRGRMARDPYRIALLAAGVGFVASGAVFSSFTLKVLRVGARFALVPYVEARIRDALDET